MYLFISSSFFFFSFLELKKVLWGNLDSLDQALLTEAR